VLVELRALMRAEGVLDRQFVQSEFFGEFDEFGLRRRTEDDLGPWVRIG